SLRCGAVSSTGCALYAFSASACCTALRYSLSICRVASSSCSIRAWEALASAARRWLSSSAVSSGAAYSCVQYDSTATARRRGIKACIDGSLQTDVKLERETLSSTAKRMATRAIRRTQAVVFIELRQKWGFAALYHDTQQQQNLSRW